MRDEIPDLQICLDINPFQNVFIVITLFVELVTIRNHLALNPRLVNFALTQLNTSSCHLDVFQLYEKGFELVFIILLDIPPSLFVPMAGVVLLSKVLGFICLVVLTHPTSTLTYRAGLFPLKSFS